LQKARFYTHNPLNTESFSEPKNDEFENVVALIFKTADTIKHINCDENWTQYKCEDFQTGKL
jgi:hypothetical protein